MPQTRTKKLTATDGVLIAGGAIAGLSAFWIAGTAIKKKYDDYNDVKLRKDKADALAKGTAFAYYY